MSGLIDLMVVAALAGSLMYRQWRRGSLHEVLLERHSTPIRQVPPGRPTKIVGRLRLGVRPLRAPLTGRPCVGYQIEVRGPNYPWPRHVVESVGIDFHVDDESGTALVCITGAAFLLDEDPGSARVGTAPPELIQRVSDQYGTSLGAPATLRYAERILAPGQRVAVVGAGAFEPDPDPSSAQGYRHVPECLVLRARGPGTLLISDVPGVLS